MRPFTRAHIERPLLFVPEPETYINVIAGLSRDKAAAQAAWATAKAEILSGERDLVVLDELTYCFHYDFLDLDEVLETLRARPPRVHVVVTGRNAPAALVALADLVSEMTLVKHPFESGVPAQLGVDF